MIDNRGVCVTYTFVLIVLFEDLFLSGLDIYDAAGRISWLLLKAAFNAVLAIL